MIIIILNFQMIKKSLEHFIRAYDYKFLSQQ
jgi:hypothetical protein